MVESGRDFAGKDVLLFLDRARLEYAPWIGAEGAGGLMSRRDETTEQSITVEITREARDAAAASLPGRRDGAQRRASNERLSRD